MPAYLMRYYNNTGHKWAYVSCFGDRKKFPVIINGAVSYRALTFEAAGNFVIGIAKIRGKRVVCHAREKGQWEASFDKDFFIR